MFRPNTCSTRGVKPHGYHWSLTDARVLLSGMFGSRTGWYEAPQLDARVPLHELPLHLVPLPAAVIGGLRKGSGDLECCIVPGYRWSDADGRSEETQILGAIELGASDGWLHAHDR